MATATRCPRCGQANDPSFSFCLECGQPLAAAPAPPRADRCAGCGAPLDPGFRFCGRCGRRVEPPSPGAEGPPVPRGATAPPRDPATTPRLASTPAHGPRLTAVRHDGRPGIVHPLPPGETLCGRLEGALLLPDDPTVSPRHARLVRTGDAVRLADLGSLNGTYVRITAPHRLAVGEEFRVGRQLLRLEPLARPEEPTARGVRPWGAPDPGATLRLAQLLDGGGVGELFPLRPGENGIGRELGEVAFPTDRYVSGRHARLDVGADGVVLTDLASSNGTFARLAGERLLAPGDQILIGVQLFRLDA